MQLKEFLTLEQLKELEDKIDSIIDYPIDGENISNTLDKK